MGIPADSIFLTDGSTAEARHSRALAESTAMRVQEAGILGVLLEIHPQKNIFSATYRLRILEFPVALLVATDVTDRWQNFLFCINNMFIFFYIFLRSASSSVDSKRSFRLCFHPPTLVKRLGVLSSSVG